MNGVISVLGQVGNAIRVGIAVRTMWLVVGTIVGGAIVVWTGSEMAKLVPDKDRDNDAPSEDTDE